MTELSPTLDEWSKLYTAAIRVKEIALWKRCGARFRGLWSLSLPGSELYPAKSRFGRLCRTTELSVLFWLSCSSRWSKH